jgi:FtsP/CotA-like multicopper oxidase with cupredoxin domain
MSDRDRIPQLAFSCNQPKAGSPATPGKVKPDKRFVREFFEDKLTAPDGKKIRFWSFEDERGGKPIPAPLMRVTEGDVVHVEMKASKKVHTIHHHGIEPEPVNDGVGHTSFEVSGSYTYQWQVDRANPDILDTGGAGTYFYHCHVNTTLHVQMGLFGVLVVDPVPSPGDPAGHRRAFGDGPFYDVRWERVLAPWAVDPRWHELNHDAGLCKLDDLKEAKLNDFRPKYFLINGTFQPRGVGATIQAPDVKIDGARPGEPILIRFVNAGYFLQRITFNGLETDVIASDGRAFRDPDGRPRSVRLLPSAGGARSFTTGAAERYDCLLNMADAPAAPGTYLVTVEFLDWIDPHPVVGVAATTITIRP